MSQSDDVEPQLITEDPRISTDNKEKQHFCILCIVFSIIVIIIIVIVIYFTESDIVTEYDTSKIPFQYQLSIRNLYAINNRYDYVISSIPDHEFTQESNLTVRDVYPISNNNYTTNSNNSNNSNETNQIELGLLISRSLWLLTPGFYEVQEDRYLPNGTMYRVITATASYTNLLYVAWGPPITIQFVNSNQTISNDLISCEYQFTWTFIANGYVNRKCKNESKFNAISYVKGSSLFGLGFYSLNEKDLYAYTTIPNLAIWTFFKRDVHIGHNAPFPTIIPALYTAYYDYLLNTRTTLSTRRIGSSS
ncbi:hypothetical protein F8M41_005373 [Gigaspora margarita]|uniref:Uncharacterized protein n=1 Tax=Gigaspora margarita TaxID=4874 RepID=A0A8H3X8A6_GIGMA|nr:hypothetical protein F8M41_005373 [Gigaspora margarita]